MWPSLAVLGEKCDLLQILENIWKWAGQQNCKSCHSLELTQFPFLSMKMTVLTNFNFLWKHGCIFFRYQPISTGIGSFDRARRDLHHIWNPSYYPDLESTDLVTSLYVTYILPHKRRFWKIWLKLKLSLLEQNANMGFVRQEVLCHPLVLRGPTRNIFFVIAVFRFFFGWLKIDRRLKAKRTPIKDGCSIFKKLEVLVYSRDRCWKLEWCIFHFF